MLAQIANRLIQQQLQSKIKQKQMQSKQTSSINPSLESNSTNSLIPCDPWLPSFSVLNSSISLHIPVHRFFSSALYQLYISHQTLLHDWCTFKTQDQPTQIHSADSMFPIHFSAQQFYRMCLYSPLRIQVYVAQVQAKLWTRNGEAVQGQVNENR
jgi:hypothetical protein